MIFRSSLLGFLVVLVVTGATGAPAEETLVVLPESFQLMYPEAEQNLVLERRNQDGS